MTTRTSRTAFQRTASAAPAGGYHVEYFISQRDAHTISVACAYGIGASHEYRGRSQPVSAERA
jgi:hypothetical protein